MFGAADNDIRLNAHALKFFDARLRGLGFQLPGSLDVRNQGDMNEDGVFPSDFMLKLPDRFQKRLAFNVADGSADFDNGDMGLFGGKIAVKPAFDFVCDMRDYLNGSAAVISPPFFLQHRPVHFPCGDIGIFCQAFVNETLIMSKIQVGLRSVVCHKDFAVLNRVHCSGINVNVGIEFLHGHPVAAGF